MSELARLGIVLEAKKFLSEVKQVTGSFDNLAKKARTTAESLKSPDGAFEALTKKAKTSAEGMKNTGKSFDDLKNKADRSASSINNKLVPGFQKLRASTTGLGGAFRGAFNGLTGLIRNLGGAMGGLLSRVFSLGTALTALPIVILGKKIVDVGASFEEGMTRATAVMGATHEEMVLLTQQAKELGRTTMFSATQASEALGFLGMAGFNASESMQALPGVLQLAIVGGIDLGRSADIVSNALTAMGLKTHEVTRVNDVFAKAITSANVNMEMLANSFNYSASTASASGTSIEELTGLIGVLGNAGIQGSSAGTALSFAMATLLKPTAGAKKVMEEFGIEVGERLVPALKKLFDQGAGTADIMGLFGLRAGRSMLALKTAGGSQAIDEMIEKMNNAKGTAQELALKFEDTFSGSVRALKSAMEGLGIAVFEAVGPDLREGVDWITEWVRKSQPQIVAFASVLWEKGKALFEGVQQMIPIIKELGSQAFNTLMLGVERVEDFALKVWDGIEPFVSLGQTVGDVSDWISDAFAIANVAIGNTWRSVVAIGEGVATLFSGIAREIKALFTGTGQIISSLYSNIGASMIALLKGDFQAVKHFAGQILDDIMNNDITVMDNIATQTINRIQNISNTAERENNLAVKRLLEGEQQLSKFGQAVDDMRAQITASMSASKQKYQEAMEKAEQMAEAQKGVTNTSEEASKAVANLAGDTARLAGESVKSAQNAIQQAQAYEQLAQSARSASQAQAQAVASPASPASANTGRREGRLSAGFGAFSPLTPFTMSIPNMQAPRVDNLRGRIEDLNTTSNIAQSSFNELGNILDRIRESVRAFAERDLTIPTTDELAEDFDEASKSVESAERFFRDLQNSLQGLSQVQSGFQSLQDQITDFQTQRDQRGFGLDDFRREANQVIEQLQDVSVNSLEEQLALNHELFDLTKKIDQLEVQSLKDQQTLAKNLRGLIGTIQGTVQDVYDEFARETPSESFERQKQRFEELRASAMSADDATEEGRSAISNFQSFASTYLDSAREVFKSSATFGEIFDGVVTDLKSMENKLTGRFFKIELSAFTEAIDELEERGFDFTKFHNSVTLLDQRGLNVESGAYVQSIQKISDLGIDTTAYINTINEMSAQGLDPTNFINSVASIQLSSDSLDTTSSQSHLNAVTQSASAVDTTNASTHLRAITQSSGAVDTTNTVSQLQGVTTADASVTTRTTTTGMANISRMDRNTSTRTTTLAMGSITRADRNVTTATSTSQMANVTRASNAVDASGAVGAMGAVSRQMDTIGTDANGSVQKLSDMTRNMDYTGTSAQSLFGELAILNGAINDIETNDARKDISELNRTINALSTKDLKAWVDGFNAMNLSDQGRASGIQVVEDLQLRMNQLWTTINSAENMLADDTVSIESLGAIFSSISDQASSFATASNNADTFFQALTEGSRQMQAMGANVRNLSTEVGGFREEGNATKDVISDLSSTSRGATTSTKNLNKNVNAIGNSMARTESQTAGFTENIGTIGASIESANTNTSGLVTNIDSIGTSSTLTTEQLLALSSNVGSLGGQAGEARIETGRLEAGMRDTVSPMGTVNTNIGVITDNIDRAFEYLSGRSDALNTAVNNQTTINQGLSQRLDELSQPVEPAVFSHYEAEGDTLIQVDSKGGRLPVAIGHSVSTGSDNRNAVVKTLGGAGNEQWWLYELGKDPTRHIGAFLPNQYLKSGTLDTGAPGPLEGGGIPAILHEHEMVIRKEHSPLVRAFMYDQGLTAGYQGSRASHSYQQGTLDVRAGGTSSKASMERLEALMERQNQLLQEINNKEVVELSMDARKLGSELKRRGRLVA